MDFKNLKAFTIPEGSVSKITAGGVVLWESMRVPKEYQEVEWIQVSTSVGAYLNLGFTFDTAAKVRLGMYAVNSEAAYIFGAAEQSGVYRCMISAPYGGGLDAYGYNTANSAYIAHKRALVANVLNELEYSFKPGKATTTFINKTNGQSSTSDCDTYTMSSNLYLFGQNYNGTARFGAYRKIKYFQYYDKNDTLICDLVPCYRKSDGVIGMYDRARNTFLTNVGSGTFTKGADV